MEINVSGLIMFLFEVSKEDFTYEMFPLENSLLITCRRDVIMSFVLDRYSCFHDCVRIHFSFVNENITEKYPYYSKVIKCYPCYRRSLKK